MNIILAVLGQLCGPKEFNDYLKVRILEIPRVAIAPASFVLVRLASVLCRVGGSGVFWVHVESMLSKEKALCDRRSILLASTERLPVYLHCCA